MDLVLKRNDYGADGIFGELSDANGRLLAFTLEHAYDKGPTGYCAKIPQGTWICQRGLHRLEKHHTRALTEPFATFEIQNVPGHSKLLFHWGNFNDDSDGCILLGASIAKRSDNSRMITASRATFARFMDSQGDVLIFHLLVIP